MERSRSDSGSEGGVAGPGGASAFADVGAREHRVLVHELHREPEQDLHVEVLLPVGREQVVEVDRERRVGDALAAAVERRLPDVAPADVWRDVVQEQVQLRALGAVDR